MRRPIWTIVAIVLALIALTLLAVIGRHQTPAGQPPLANLSDRSLPQLKAEFNESADSERVLLLLSPTCPVCVKGSSVVNAVLKSHPASKVRVIAVWEPILPTDWDRPTSVVLDMLSDRRAIQWWDNQHLVARLLSSSATGQDPRCCTRHGTLWDVIAVYPPGVRWNDSLPAPAYFAGPVVRGAPRWESNALQ